MVEAFYTAIIVFGGCIVCVCLLALAEEAAQECREIKKCFDKAKSQQELWRSGGIIKDSFEKRGLN